MTGSGCRQRPPARRSAGCRRRPLAAVSAAVLCFGGGCRQPAAAGRRAPPPAADDRRWPRWRHNAGAGAEPCRQAQAAACGSCSGCQRSLQPLQAACCRRWPLAAGRRLHFACRHRCGGPRQQRRTCWSAAAAEVEKQAGKELQTMETRHCCQRQYCEGAPCNTLPSPPTGL